MFCYELTCCCICGHELDFQCLVVEVAIVKQSDQNLTARHTCFSSCVLSDCVTFSGDY